ncbi:hypothetical protein J4456_00345 [Candidatus Pacearchaeota archaeon]|nr:hypothetical protein [Candidatus Pacearchaeota archaeon]
MNKEKFTKTYFEKLLDDEGIEKYFNQAKTEREKEMLKENLRLSLEKSYETYAKEYFDSKGIGSYLSTFLRYTGAGADTLGTYMFWALGGAGFGAKGIGLLEKTAADALDSYHYAKHAKGTLTEKVGDESMALGEGVATRAAAYLPLGVGELADLMRGKNKFDNKVVGRAVEYAKNNFVDYLKRVEEKEPYIVPLQRFKNPAYSSDYAQAA